MPGASVGAARIAVDTERIAVDKSIARLNIEFFRKRLGEEADEAKRALIARLLAEEEAKLQAISAPERKYGG